jgi:hypothetical protein
VRLSKFLTADAAVIIKERRGKGEEKKKTKIERQ